MEVSEGGRFRGVDVSGVWRFQEGRGSGRVEAEGGWRSQKGRGFSIAPDTLRGVESPTQTSPHISGDVHGL